LQAGSAPRRLLLPAARPTLLLFKELLCIRRGLSGGHRADKRGPGDEHRHKQRREVRHRHLHLHSFFICIASFSRFLRTGCCTTKTNDGARANRWVSHARVKRSDQSCMRRHSQDRFVQGVMLDPTSPLQRCRKTSVASAREPGQSCSTSLRAISSRCFHRYRSDGSLARGRALCTSSCTQ
jgi:hypothetical protein